MEENCISMKILHHQKTERQAIFAMGRLRQIANVMWMQTINNRERWRQFKEACIQKMM